jgi:predicted O-methyltransferase YrrM
MKEEIIQSHPEAYQKINEATRTSGFTMASDLLTCSLLRTLAAAKPCGKFLELGTGTGLSTSWILDGMDAESSMVSIDNDETFLRIAERYLGNDKRLELIAADGGQWIVDHFHSRFDYIFADTWPGKYFYLDEVLALLNPGGLYIIDDMLPQPNWPEGHDEKAAQLLDTLTQRSDLVVTRQAWASGVVIAVKKN